MSMLETSIIGVLSLAVLIAAWRVLRGTRSWRWTRVVGHAAMASLLYLLIFPPAIERPRDIGIVLTPGVAQSQILKRDLTQPILALPGVAISDRSIVQVPDLATGLRQHPEIGDLHVIGDGLPARDRDALGDRGMTFTPSDRVPGIVELQIPHFVRAGSIGMVRGRVDRGDEVQLRILDRNGALMTSTLTDKEGRFELSLRMKAAGQSLYRLQRMASAEKVGEEIPIPMVVVSGDPVHVLILAGGPDADLKYLRRWIIDSGNTVSSRISLSPGIEQRQNSASVSVESLAASDLLIVDERAWSALSEADKILIRAAVEKGLGLLLRVTAALPKKVAADWKVYGFDAQSADVSQSVSLARPIGGVSLTRLPLRFDGQESVPLAVTTEGAVLSEWRAVAQGRVGTWLLLDSYRLQLNGETSRYGSLWSELFARIGRARGKRLPEMPTRARVGERSVLCDLKAEASIEDRDAKRHDLLVNDEPGLCAAWWPEKSGWKTLINADSHWPIYVYANDVAGGLARMKVRDATSQRVKVGAGPSHYAAPMPRWPLFLVWLLVSAAFWWLERPTSRRSN